MVEQDGVNTKRWSLYDKRSWLFVLLATFAIGSFLNLATPVIVHANTAAQQQYCFDTFKAGTVIFDSKGAKPEWVSNKCSESCQTKNDVQSNSGISSATTATSTVVSCTDPSGGVSQSAATDKIIIDGYSKAVCGSDTACIKKTAPCIESYLKNGYENSPTVVYPEVDTSIFAGCIATATGKSEKSIKSSLDSAKAQVTADANKSNVSANQTACEKAGNTWDSAANKCVDKKEVCAADGGKWNDTDNKCDGAKGKTSCSPDIGAVGWVVCPVMSFISSLNDKIFELIKALLEFKGSLLQTSGGTSGAGIYTAWSAFRNIANVAFVVVFMIIIFSQVSNIGISNYGIKRMLPKLIIGAILVNMSFYVCAAAVDVSNVLGSGLKSLFDGLSTGIGKPPTWTDLTSKVLAGTFAVGAAAVFIGVGIAAQGGVMGFLALLAPIALAAILAFLMILAILVARWTFIILLLVISPLAFVAYLLPNTENWFKKWWKMFSSLLFLYPVISVLFGASTLAAAIVSSLSSGGGSGWLIVALGVQAIPLFAAPSLLKGALAATGSIGTKMQGWGNKATSRIGGRAKENYNKSNFAMARKIRQSGREQYRRSQLAGRVAGGGVGGRVLSGIGLTAERREGQRRLSTSAIAQQDKDFQEEKSAEITRMKNANLTHDERHIIATGGTARGISGTSLAARMAAQEEVINTGDAEQINRLIDHASGNLNAGNVDDARQLNGLADSLQRSPNKPAYVQPADLEAIRHNGDGAAMADSSGMIRSALENNVYSAEKQATTGRQEMGIVRGEIANIASQNGGTFQGSQYQGAVQRFVSNAHQASTDPQLQRQLGKQRDMVEQSARGSF